MPKIILQDSQRDLRLSKKKIERGVSFLLKKLLISTDEVTFHFVSKKKIAELHRDFFDDPTPTDCITLPMDPLDSPHLGYHILGEVFICPKVAIEYAEEHGIAPEEELLRYVVHGLLHLIGYEDHSPKERARMKRKESACLKAILELY